MEATDPMEGKCTATSKQSGNRCRRAPIPGGTVCVMHGGSAPQVKLKAQERLAAYQDKAIDRLFALVEQKEYPSTAFAAVRDVLDRTLGKPTEKVEMEVTGEVSIIHTRLNAARARMAARRTEQAAQQ
jgi:hypothetical protein